MIINPAYNGGGGYYPCSEVVPELGGCHYPDPGPCEGLRLGGQLFQ